MLRERNLDTIKNYVHRKFLLISAIQTVILPLGTREASFVHAISSAGVAWAVTRACSTGMLGRKCGCDKKFKGDSGMGWTWAGCSDDIDFGVKFSKSFVDARERGQRSTKPYRVVMNLHNNAAGREVSFDVVRRRASLTTAF